MNRPINEQDEFLLNRLVDNDLSAEEAAALRTRLEREPELRRAYQAITRIDALLAARRSVQPQVDWAKFHRQVMNQVEAEAAHGRTIRLVDFLRVVLPLAAAAAIALVVWFWPHGQPAPIGSNPPGNTLTYNLPKLGPGAPGSVTDDAAITIQYVRGEPTAPESGMNVHFVRSDNLAKDRSKIDEENRNRQPGATFLAGNIRAAQAVPQNLMAQATPLFD